MSLGSETGIMGGCGIVLLLYIYTTRTLLSYLQIVLSEIFRYLQKTNYLKKKKHYFTTEKSTALPSVTDCLWPLQELDQTAKALLAKCVESNAFIREDVDKALNAMVEHTSVQRALPALLAGGTS